MEEMSRSEVAAVTRERERIRARVQSRRVKALREIAALRPDQCHAAPEIARSALKGGRESS